MGECPSIFFAQTTYMAADKTSLPSIEILCPEVEGSARFRGSFEHSMDSKGRVAVPAPFRNALNGQSLVVTNYICDGYRCLEAFPSSVWVSFEDKLKQRSRFEPKLKTLEHYYLSRAQDCILDSNGRINLPHKLVEYAGLNKEVTLTSTLFGFRIWDLKVANLVFEEAEKKLLDNPELFMELDLGV